MTIIKKYLPLIIAGVAGLIAVVLINVYIGQRTQEAQQSVIAGQKKLATVVIARRDIPAGEVIKEDMLREKTVNRSLLQPRAATSMGRAIGKAALAPISKGEQILLNKLAIPGKQLSLSAKIPHGKRAITIPVDNISSVGGMIKPGDHVDIVGQVPIPVMTIEGKQATQLTTMTLFQNVLVLAVGQEYTTIPAASGEKKERTRTLSPVITLALMPQEANLVAFAQEQGRIRLVLRSPGDTQTHSPAPASWDSLYRNIMPRREEPVQSQAPRSGRNVEIYRGTSRESKIIE